MVIKDYLIHNVNKLILECEKGQKEISNEKTDYFSPDTYNSISFVIFKKLLLITKEIAKSKKNIDINHNLAFILLTELCIKICDETFRAYEQKNLHKGNIPKLIIRKHFNISDKIKIFLRDLLNNENFLINSKKNRVGYLGLTTFSWIELGKYLKEKDIILFNADNKRKIFIPELNFQKSLIIKSLEQLYSKLGKKLDIKLSINDSFLSKNYFENLNFFTDQEQNIKIQDAKLIISGSIGNTPRLRAYALDYMKKNIHFSLIHHGAQYNIFNESYYAFYEGLMCNSKVIYGNIAKQKKIKTLGSDKNVFGQKITYLSRTDNYLSEIKRQRSKEKINPIKSFKNKKILYFSSEFTALRYGPNRDVHPILYLDWQNKLLDWIKNETQMNPIVRLHPKRQTKVFDPINFKDQKNFSIKSFKEADVFCIDYPTTSFAYVNATNKPVIFFDLGMRKLSKSSLKIIKKRCLYTKVKWTNIEASFKDIGKELNKNFTNEFTNTFTLERKRNNEAKNVAQHIADIIK